MPITGYDHISIHGGSESAITPHSSSDCTRSRNDLDILCLPLELYHLPSDKNDDIGGFVLLLQRSPARHGASSQLASEISSLLLKFECSSVALLCGATLNNRAGINLSENAFFLSSKTDSLWTKKLLSVIEKAHVVSAQVMLEMKDSLEKAAAVGSPEFNSDDLSPETAIEDNWCDVPIRIPHVLAAASALDKVNIEWIVLGRYCAEGDNSSDGLGLGFVCNCVLRSSNNLKGTVLRAPDSWRHLFGPSWRETGESVYA
jgi:hypothetical protein